MEKWLKICHDGKMRYVELPSSVDESSFFLNALYRELDCDSIEIVRVRGFDAFFSGIEPVIIIDECGKLKDDWELRINGLCTLGYAPLADCIVGDAVLGFRVGPDVLPLPESLYASFIRDIESVFSDFRFVAE